MDMVWSQFALPVICGAVVVAFVARDRREEERSGTRSREVAGQTKRVGLRCGNGLGYGKMTHAILAIAMLSIASAAAKAEEVIHARAGQVVATDAAAKTLTLKVADGSIIVFKDVASPEPPMAFDAKVRSKTVPADGFHTVGAQVVVFYFGYDTPTAVAVKDLGSDVPTRRAGSVASFDRRQHLLTLKTGTPEPEKVLLSDETIVDTAEGVMTAAEFRPSKGDQVHCVAKANSAAALFVAVD